VTPIRAAVVGVGHLGRHHARILGGMPGVTFVGAVDTVRERAEAAVANAPGARAFTDAAELTGLVDAVVVAVPTVHHLEVAEPLLARGVSCLVEKPLAVSLAEADRMLDAARRGGAVLATGHSERFNPAMIAARPMLTQPRFVEVHRLSAFPERSLDVDVVFDVMIHDLDIILSVDGSEVTSVEAVGINVLTPKVDIANARIKFASGCVANVTASRISREPVRKVRFFQQDSYVSIDYAAREVEAWRVTPQAGDRPKIEGGPLPVPAGEPLAAELEDFIAAVRDRRAPAVDGLAGRAALAIARKVHQAMVEGRRQKAEGRNGS
jgi:predicted dehydrogenase